MAAGDHLHQNPQQDGTVGDERFDDLADLPIWLAWRIERFTAKSGKVKERKRPVSIHTGFDCDGTDKDAWGTRAQAEAAVHKCKLAGIGIALTTLPSGLRLCGLDSDKCYAFDDDQIAPWAPPVHAVIDGCLRELSPSRRGCHHLFLIDPAMLPEGVGEVSMYAKGEGDERHGFEVYVTENRWFTVTGWGVEGELLILPPLTLIRLFNALEAFKPRHKARPGEFRHSDHDKALQILDHLPNDGFYDDHAQWMGVIAAVYNATGGSNAGKDAAGRWSRDGATLTGEEGVSILWDYFSRKGARNDIRHLINEARKHGYEPYLKREHKTNSHDPKSGGPSSAQNRKELPLKVCVEDFVAYMPQRGFIFMKTGQMWPASSVNGRLLPVLHVTPAAEQEWLSAAEWLVRNRPVEQMTWAPGEKPLIKDRLIVEGGWMADPGATIFNQYVAPMLKLGDPEKAERWSKLVRRAWPGAAEHLFDCFAHRVQRPQEKINHAVVLGGPQGIGKDSILAPVIQAIGPWNAHSIGPMAFVGRFNGFVKSVLLRVSEARDADYSTFQFYEHTKTYAASPPEVLRVDQKYMQEYYVANVCFLVITTNHLLGGLYLPADDRRHYVAWSDLIKEDFTEEYWRDLWRWYEQEGGYGHIAAWLARRDLSAFNPKAPPPKTAAFWTIVDASRPTEDAEFADVLDNLGNPIVTTLDEARKAAKGDFAEWLADRKNRRNIPHRFEAAGYVPVRNPNAKKDGQWVIDGARQTVYGRRDCDLNTLLTHAQALASSRTRSRRI